MISLVSIKNEKIILYLEKRLDTQCLVSYSQPVEIHNIVLEHLDDDVIHTLGKV